MKIFKNIDKKFKDIGFKKIEDDKYAVIYERDNSEYAYTQVLAINHKKSGRHIVQSYDKGLFDEKLTGNICVGLTYYEMKLVLKKMKQKKWNKRR